MSKVVSSSQRRFFHSHSHHQQQPQPSLNHLQQSAAVAMIGLQQLQQVAVASQMNSTATTAVLANRQKASHTSSKNKVQMEEKPKTSKTKETEKKYNSQLDKDIREGDLIFVKLGKFFCIMIIFSNISSYCILIKL
ncbi:hypothetical protein C9374_001116 [Naegleria lovaniensis]|uniref:Uncharacterized protein n=1 Tax=Naegleria lovaniensis TaxID=51637 RepID=A0AA88KRT6_NAELO|nr:uncharacterized protein C9374_001116 [Naegleria lovaniensis]KAG2387522.1 hypothetical protein C9374_001116 [Naegleria lovaniensis]